MAEIKNDDAETLQNEGAVVIHLGAKGADLIPLIVAEE